MTKRGATLLVVLALAIHATAQFTPTAQSARNSALGGCLILQPETGTQLDLGWRQGYLSQGMATKTLQATIPAGKTTTAYAGYSHFGDAVYHEQQATAAYAIMLNWQITVGVYGQYSNIGTDDAHYKPQHWLDAGVVLTAAAGDRTGAYLVAGSRHWDTDRPLGGRIGATYSPTDGLLTVAELAVEERTRLRCGLEYTYEKRYSARAGLSTNPLVMTFGVGYKIKNYHIDLSTEVHQVLGLSPQITLGLCL